MFKTIQPIPTTRWQSGPESPTALDQVMLPGRSALDPGRKTRGGGQSPVRGEPGEGGCICEVSPGSPLRTGSGWALLNSCSFEL